jgi:hypothetical protein
VAGLTGTGRSCARATKPTPAQRTRDEADPGSAHALFYPDYMSELDPREVPRLVEDRLSPWESLGRLPEPLLLLVLEALRALWFALLALHRAPVAEAADG